MKLFFLLTKKPISTPVVHLERAPFDRDTFLKQSINVFFFFFFYKRKITKRGMDLCFTELLWEHVRDCLEFAQTPTNVLINPIKIETKPLARI